MNRKLMQIRQDEFLEILMARIIIAGGRRFEPEKLRNMYVGDLLDMIYPNSIELQSVSTSTNQPY